MFAVPPCPLRLVDDGLSRAQSKAGTLFYNLTLLFTSLSPRPFCCVPLSSLGFLFTNVSLIILCRNPAFSTQIKLPGLTLIFKISGF